MSWAHWIEQRTWDTLSGPVSVDKIDFKRVAHDLGIYGTGGSRAVSTLRQAFVYYLRKEFGIGPSKIGKFIGKDHATILYHERKAIDFVYNNDKIFMVQLGKVNKYFEFYPKPKNNRNLFFK